MPGTRFHHGRTDQHLWCPMPASDLKMPDHFPLGNAQLPLWFDSQLSGPAGYRLGCWIKTERKLDADCLRASLRVLLEHHEALRLRIDPNTPRQWISSDCTAPLHEVTLSAQDPDAAFQAHLAHLFSMPLPFGDAPLFRVHLLTIGALRYLVLCFHHIIADSLTLQLVLQQWFQTYFALSQGLPLPQIAPSSVMPLIAADQEYNTSAQFQRDLAYWKARLANLPEKLITAPPKPSQTPFAHTAAGRIPAERGFLQAAKAANLSAPRALFGLLAITFARRFGQDDLICGLALHRRDAKTRHTMGMMTGVIPLRIRFEEWWSLQDCLAAFNEAWDGDLRHSRISIDALSRALRMTGKGGVGLFDIAMSYTPGAAALGLPGDISSAVIHTREASPISFHATDDRATGALCYHIAINPDYAGILDPNLLAELLEGAIAQFVQDCAPNGARPDFGTIPAMAPSEAAQISRFEVTALDWRCARLEHLFDAQATAAPDTTAIVDCDGTALSYGFVQEQSFRLARSLIAAGVRAGDVVGVRMARSAATCIALLAILRAGAVYLPLDPDYPAERLGHAAQDAGAVLILDRLDSLPDSPATALPMFQDPEALAYIIYTSGTSGRPKGVAVAHRALAHLCAARAGAHCNTGFGDHVLAGVSVGFDVSLQEMLLPLLTGATVVMAPDLKQMGAAEFWDLLRKRKVTHLNMVPSVFAAMLSAPPPDGLALRQLMLGGEALSGAVAQRIARALPDVALFNVYGPTETCIEASYHRVTPADFDMAVLPIGQPLPNYLATVRDAQLQPVGIGIDGELALGGPGLARGYMNLPQLTATRFVADPLEPGRTLYRTGDKVRWRADGVLEFLGRMDNQVKIRGFRIEPEEIAAVMMGQPGVQEAMVVARATGSAAPRLEGFFTGTAEAGALWAALRAALPGYMVPAALHRLDGLPRGPNGKLDPKRLPTLGPDLAQGQHIPPEGALETRIAHHIAALLEEETAQPAPQIGRHDNFFTLGGNSLLAVRLAAALEQDTGTPVPLRLIFEAGDIAALASALGENHDSDVPQTEADVAQARRDIALAATLPPAPKGQATPLPAAQAILLTGATGLIGRYLLRDLLQGTRAKIICLARGKDAASAHARIVQELHSIDGAALPQGYAARIHVEMGDLALPDLGLTAQARDSLAREVDMIVHNGAGVHAFKPYAMMRGVNTLSTLQLLQIMSAHKPKSLVYISTLGVLQTPLDRLRDGFDARVTEPALSSGYNLSKWAAEHMILTARDKGYRATILRPGLVIGDSRTGYYAAQDIGQGFLRLFLDLRAIPSGLSAIPLPWASVDHAAQMILALAQADVPQGIAHIFTHGAAPAESIARAMDANGLSPHLIGTHDWLSRAIALLQVQRNHPSGWLLPRLRGYALLLQDIPDSMIPLQEPEALLARYAPPPLPLPEIAADMATAERSLAAVIRWILAQNPQNG